MGPDIYCLDELRRFANSAAELTDARVQAIILLYVQEWPTTDLQELLDWLNVQILDPALPVRQYIRIGDAVWFRLQALKASKH